MQQSNIICLFIQCTTSPEDFLKQRDRRYKSPSAHISGILEDVMKNGGWKIIFLLSCIQFNGQENIIKKNKCWLNADIKSSPTPLLVYELCFKDCAMLYY